MRVLKDLRVLHLTSEPPSVTGLSGGSTRQFFLLRQLVRRGAKVKTICPALSDRLLNSGALEAAQDADIDLVPIARKENRLTEALGASLKDPSVVADLLRAPWWGWRGSVFWPSLKQETSRIIFEWKPDVVLIECDHLVHWASKIAPDSPIILCSQNASWNIYSTMGETLPRGFRRLRMKIEARRFKRHVRRHISRFSAIVVPSPEDADEFKALTHSPVFIVPNGADCQALTVTHDADPSLISFIGTLSYGPNVEGLEWFAHKIWPAVREAHPDARFEIVGRTPVNSVKNLAAISGIEVVGPVESVLPQITKTSVLTAPLRSGSGTKLKVVEALAAGRPLVATPMAMAGIDAEDGRHFMLARNEGEFAAAIGHLLEDAELRNRIGIAAKELANEFYDWSIQGDLLFNAIVESLDAK